VKCVTLGPGCCFRLFFGCYFEVLGPKVASSSHNLHPRLLFRIAGCDHKGRQKQPKIAILMHPWLHVRIACGDHKGRQKQPQITISMHSGFKSAYQVVITTVPISSKSSLHGHKSTEQAAITKVAQGSFSMLAPIAGRARNNLRQRARR
jgi:hypothetical protein